MKLLTVLICCLALIACEDEADDATLADEVLGDWSITNMGEIANADCSGDLDYYGWDIAVAFGMTETETVSWEIDGNLLCIEGECATVDLSGDTFTIVASEDAYCEDADGEEVDGVDMTACEAAGNDWYEATCYELTATRQ